jgi:hypothetical protein
VALIGAKERPISAGHYQNWCQGTVQFFNLLKSGTETIIGFKKQSDPLDLD